MLRPINLALLLLAQGLVFALLDAFPGVSPPMPQTQRLVLLGLTVLACAGGNIINDIQDRPVDARNKPGRNPVGREIGVTGAWTAYAVFSGLAVSGGIWLAGEQGMPKAAIWPVLAVFALARYSWDWQYRALWGNMAVAALTALAMLLPALFQDGGVGEAWPYLAAFAGLAFGSSWTREWIKDLEDRDGDRAAGSQTAAIRWSLAANRAGLQALLALQGLGVLAMGAWFRPLGWLPWLWAGCALVGYGWLFRALLQARQAADFALPSRIAKLLMLLGVLWIGILAAALNA